MIVEIFNLSTDLEINFDKVIYAVNEEGTPTCNVRLEHRKTQGHFTVHFESVSVEEAMMRLGGATEEETISSPFHATQGNILNCNSNFFAN